MINELKYLEPEIKRKFNLTIPQLKQEKRTDKLCKARCYVYYILYNKYNYSLSEIGKEFNKTHATVLNSLSNFESYGFVNKENEKDNYLIDELQKEKESLYCKIKAVESLLNLYNKK